MRYSLFALVMLLAAGCSGEADLCAMASDHMAQCAGVVLELAETCNPGRAGRLLSIPCSDLGAGSARGTFSSSSGSLLGAWISDVSDPGAADWGGAGLGGAAWNTGASWGDGFNASGLDWGGSDLAWGWNALNGGWLQSGLFGFGADQHGQHNYAEVMTICADLAFAALLCA
jgi:hypothetical protein